MSVDQTPLLDILTRDRALPEGYDRWAMRSCWRDLTSSRGYRWPWPGSVAEAPGPIFEDNTSPCPQAVGDGLCVALDAEGMASGGIPMVTVLLVAVRHEDVLASDAHKVRVRRALVVDVVGIGRDADLRGANLNYANLYGADLRGANLDYANLYGADLRGANLNDANLYGANLDYANLNGANLRGANLYGADLRDANLNDANLRGANLYGADLRGANLDGADLRGANLYDAKGAHR